MRCVTSVFVPPAQSQHCPCCSADLLDAFALLAEAAESLTGQAGGENSQVRVPKLLGRSTQCAVSCQRAGRRRQSVAGEIWV